MLGMRVYVPTRGQVFCETAATLSLLTQRARVPLPRYVRGNASVAAVRNHIVQDFMADRSAEVLVMCDDDVVPPEHALHKLQEDIREYPIVSGVCLLIRPGTMHLPNVFTWDEKQKRYGINLDVFGKTGLIETDAVGTGFIAIRREVLGNPYITAPFAAKYDHGGMITMGEDLAFCRKAESQGYKIAVDMDIFCEHHVAVFANGVAQAYTRQIERLLTEKEAHGGTPPSLHEG